MIRYLLPLALALSAAPAFAAPPPGSDPNSAISKWYNGLYQPITGIHCCGKPDCGETRAYKDSDGVWHAQVPRGEEAGEWVVVPNDVILADDYPNPTGHAVLCFLDEQPVGRPWCLVKPQAGG